jgi:starch phosphorylase
MQVSASSRARGPGSASDSAGEPTWWEREHGEPGFLVAYFSPEFALDASLPVYAGGLGVLAGDHLRSAGDLGIPIVGVGLLYRRGYFRQSVVGGRQRESYPELDPEAAGLTLERDPDGTPVHVEVELVEEAVLAQIWRTEVRGAPVYLLDADAAGNSQTARSLTDVLYVTDRELRIRQEVLLGVGGARALSALGLEPTVYHLNEGHAAFLGLERVRALVADGELELGDALEQVRATTVFTTHTPVPEGNERFDVELARRYLEQAAEECGVGVDELLALGLGPGDEAFGLTPLALRTAGRANGVSKLHGAVSRSMWRGLWPGTKDDGVPIGHVTNAIHAPTWVSPELHALLRDAGVNLDGGPGEQRWERAAELDPSALWEAHALGKARLLESVAELSQRRLGGNDLDPKALTIVYARRFAPYKRAALLFSDLERALQLVTDPERPIQLLFAGKAYPGDEKGKEMLAQIAGLSTAPETRGRVAFLADYDLDLARLLVQGADVWLNTPRRPQEASGTSGMKAGMNGVLNLSVLDGWWPEAYSPEIGWAIPVEVSARGDKAEANELMRLLEEEVVPAFYERSGSRLPLRWIGMMRASIATIGAGFNGARMVEEYVDGYYLPAYGAAVTLR